MTFHWERHTAPQKDLFCDHLRQRKLFHWLYALLMLLPIFAIGSSCLISTFNMSSKEESIIQYKYETNDVNSLDDLIVGRIYHYKRDISSLSTYHYFLFSYDMFNIDGTIFTSNSFDVVGVLKTSNDTIRFNRRSGNTNLGDIKFDNSVLFECDFVYAPFTRRYLAHRYSKYLTYFSVLLTSNRIKATYKQ